MILLKLVAVTLAVVYAVECNTVTTPDPLDTVPPEGSQVNVTSSAEYVPRLRTARYARRGPGGRFRNRGFNNIGGQFNNFGGPDGGGLGLLGGGLSGIGSGLSGLAGGLSNFGGGGGLGNFGGGGGLGNFAGRGRNRNNIAVSNQNVNANAGDFGNAFASGVSNAIA